MRRKSRLIRHPNRLYRWQDMYRICEEYKVYKEDVPSLSYNKVSSFPLKIQYHQIKNIFSSEWGEYQNVENSFSISDETTLKNKRHSNYKTNTQANTQKSKDLRYLKARWTERCVRYFFLCCEIFLFVGNSFHRVISHNNFFLNPRILKSHTISQRE